MIRLPHATAVQVDQRSGAKVEPSLSHRGRDQAARSLIRAVLPKSVELARDMPVNSMPRQQPHQHPFLQTFPAGQFFEIRHDRIPAHDMTMMHFGERPELPPRPPGSFHVPVSDLLAVNIEHPHIAVRADHARLGIEDRQCGIETARLHGVIPIHERHIFSVTALESERPCFPDLARYSVTQINVDRLIR